MQPSSNKSPKKFIVPVLVLLGIVFLAGVIYGYITSKETKEINEAFYKQVSSVDSVARFASGTLDPKIFETKEFQETGFRITGLLSTICDNIENKDFFPQSNIFKIVKSELDSIRAKIPEGSQTEYTYIYLPKVVQDTCSQRGSDYTDMLVSYIQTEGIVAADPNARKLLGEYIRELPDKFSGTLSKTATKEEWSKFFLETNKTYLEQIYYPFYIQNEGDLDNFLNKPINSLEQSNAIKRQTFEKIDRAVKSLGLTFDEYTNLLQSIYVIPGKLTLVQSLLIDYNELVKAAPTIEKSLSSAASFEKFLRSGDYKKTLADPKLANILSRIDKKMLVYAATSPDYADGLHEDWTAQKFGDEKKWAVLIRIHFAMLLK